MPIAILEILKDYPEFVQPLNEPRDLGNAGGLSGARFWRFPSMSGELVVKRWPNPGPTFAILRRNHEWLRQCSALRFVPQPIPSAQGETFVEIQGRFWELQRWMPGSPPSESLVNPDEVRLAFEALARLHNQWSMDSKEEMSPGLAARLEEVEAWLARDFATLQRLLPPSFVDPTMELVRQWLARARILAPGVALLLRSVARRPLRLQPCVKDLRREHWLFEAGRVSGLIDFGAMDRDHIATDISRLASDWLGDDLGLRELALGAYRAIRPLDSADLELISVFDQSADLLVGGHWARWLLLDPREFDDPAAIGRGLANGVERLARLARGRSGAILG